MSEERILEGLINLRGKIGGDLATFGEVCRFLGGQREEIEPIIRGMEARGLITCAPKQGPIAVLSLPEAGAHDTVLGAGEGMSQNA